MKLFAALLITAACTMAADTATMKGWVIDSACTFTKHFLEKPISSECAIACAKKGSPLVIQADDGNIYLPISDKTPADGQNARLLPFAGKRVVVTGTTYERSGAHAIVIAKIQAEK